MADHTTLDDLIMAKDDLSGVDIKAICTEAGLIALWECRMKLKNEDFKESKEDVLYKKKNKQTNKKVPLEGLYLY